jgi:hypothetical protein
MSCEYALRHPDRVKQNKDGCRGKNVGQMCAFHQAGGILNPGNPLAHYAPGTGFCFWAMGLISV